MTDIIIPLGTGSRFDDIELKFALRSVEKHLSNVRDVYVIGNWPDWLRNSTVIKFEEKNLMIFKEKNICNKVSVACSLDNVSNDFLFMNDDHFLLADCDAATFPYYHCGPIVQKVVDQYNPYRKVIRNTVQLVGDRANNFDCHCPILFNQEIFFEVMNKIDWEKDYGYMMKTLYCHGAGIEGKYIPDVKINAELSVSDIKGIIYSRPWFSVGDAGLRTPMFSVLEELYPHKSKWER